MLVACIHDVGMLVAASFRGVALMCSRGGDSDGSVDLVSLNS